MKLPLLLSVPHAGLQVPPEAADLCILDEHALAADGDGGAAAVYYPLRGQVAAFVTTDIARAIVDQNRAPDDFRKDGVIKTHTCWDVPVYCRAPAEGVVETLLERYYFPYHRDLAVAAGPPQRLGVDCHTMADVAPPVAPDPGAERPMVCLSDGNGTSCPGAWTKRMFECLNQAFDGDARLNDPFGGGYITRTYGVQLPFLQLELSRTPRLSEAEKTQRVERALTDFCRHQGWLD